MALFKVLRGSSDDFITDLTKANVIPPFNDGFCYFLKDTRMFYIDYAVKDSDGNIIERHRVPLNADDAKTLDNALLIRDKLSDGDNEILSAKLVHTEIARIDNLISTTIGDAITALQNDKMDKVDPTGSGSFSMNGGKAIGTNSFAWGDDEKAPGPTEATGLNAFAMGLGSIASGNLSFSRGEYCVASGAYSSADGNAVEATATYAHAEGNNTTASGQGAHAEGEYGVASGKDSHSEGGYTKAQGDYSHSEGYNTTATHKAQHVEGEWNELDPSTNTSANRGVYVHITGIGTGDADRKNGFTVDWSGNLWGARSLGHGNNISASGENSYAGGLNVIASGIASHAEGSNNEAQGMSSHSEGDSTLAEGDYSHAEGFFVKTTGVASHAQNEYTIASGDAQTAMGRNNVEDTTSALIIGNGSSPDSRSNAYQIDWDGNSVQTGSLQIGSYFILGDESYGYDLPESGVENQLFFQAVAGNELTTGNYEEYLPLDFIIHDTIAPSQSINEIQVPSKLQVFDLEDFSLYADGLLLTQGLYYYFDTNYQTYFDFYLKPDVVLEYVINTSENKEEMDKILGRMGF